MSENSTLPVDQSFNPEEIVIQDSSLETANDSSESTAMADLNSASKNNSESGETNLVSTNNSSEEVIVQNIVIEETITEITSSHEVELDSEIEPIEDLQASEENSNLVSETESEIELTVQNIAIEESITEISALDEVESVSETEAIEDLQIPEDNSNLIPEIASENLDEVVSEATIETPEVISTLPIEQAIDATDQVVSEPVVITEISSEVVLLSVNETELEELEKAEAETQNEDYSGLDKEQMVKLAEQLNRDSDPVIALRVIQKLRPLFDVKYQEDKNEALEKFIAEGNEKEAFEYKHSGLELRFNQASKGIYEKRKINHEFQQKEKAKNLEQKLTLLDQLRQLVDDHEHTPGYDKFKIIREDWKKIGPVGPEHAQNLNASFYVLIERFYSLSEIYYNLRDFDRKKNLDLKLELITKIEKLANEPSISKAMKDLMHYQDDYKSLGPIPKEKLDEVRERLKKAVDVLYDRRRVFNEERKNLIAEEVTLKEAILGKLTDFETFVSQSSKEWQTKTQELLGLQEEWKTIPSQYREKTQDLNKQFWTVFKQFMNNKNDFFKQLDKGKKDVLAQKQALADEVHSLKDGEDWDGIANRMKQLQVDWKNVAPVYGKEGQKVYEEFKAGIDHFFGKLRDQRSGEDKVHIENLQQKEAICTEIEALAASGAGTKVLLEELKERFRSLGFVPTKSILRINSRFSKGLIDLIESSKEIAGSEKERLKINLLSNRSTYSSEGVKTLKNQEGYIQKRLQQLRKDVGNLEDNVSMFKMSKNAMALIEDVQKRINLSKLEIKELESQLKEIRAGEKVS